MREWAAHIRNFVCFGYWRGAQARSSEGLAPQTGPRSIVRFEKPEHNRMANDD